MLTRSHPVVGRRDGGASVVEYGLLIAAIAAVVVVVVFALGGVVREVLSDPCETATSSPSSGSSCPTATTG